jgi:hypothetical protein
VAAGYDGKQIVKNAIGVIIKMAFEDGFFHADPHPGNIIVMGTPAAPVLGLIDLGMVGRLSPQLRDGMIELLVAAGRNDPVAVADQLYALGRPTRKIDMQQYRGEVTAIAEKHLVAVPRLGRRGGVRVRVHRVIHPRGPRRLQGLVGPRPRAVTALVPTSRAVARRRWSASST